MDGASRREPRGRLASGMERAEPAHRPWEPGCGVAGARGREAGGGGDGGETEVILGDFCFCAIS